MGVAVEDYTSHADGSWLSYNNETPRPLDKKLGEATILEWIIGSNLRPRKVSGLKLSASLIAERRRTSICPSTSGVTFVARMLIGLGIATLPKPTPKQVLPASTSTLLEGSKGAFRAM